MLGARVGSWAGTSLLPTSADWLLRGRVHALAGRRVAAGKREEDLRECRLEAAIVWRVCLHAAWPHWLAPLVCCRPLLPSKYAWSLVHSSRPRRSLAWTCPPTSWPWRSCGSGRWAAAAGTQPMCADGWGCVRLESYPGVSLCRPAAQLIPPVLLRRPAFQLHRLPFNDPLHATHRPPATAAGSGSASATCTATCWTRGCPTPRLTWWPCSL